MTDQADLGEPVERAELEARVRAALKGALTPGTAWLDMTEDGGEPDDEVLIDGHVSISRLTEAVARTLLGELTELMREVRAGLDGAR